MALVLILALCATVISGYGSTDELHAVEENTETRKNIDGNSVTYIDTRIIDVKDETKLDELETVMEETTPIDRGVENTSFSAEQAYNKQKIYMQSLDEDIRAENSEHENNVDENSNARIIDETDGMKPDKYNIPTTPFDRDVRNTSSSEEVNTSDIKLLDQDIKEDLFDNEGNNGLDDKGSKEEELVKVTKDSNTHEYEHTERNINNVQNEYDTVFKSKPNGNRVNNNKKDDVTNIQDEVIKLINKQNLLIKSLAKRFEEMMIEREKLIEDYQFKDLMRSLNETKVRRNNKNVRTKNNNGAKGKGGKVNNGKKKTPAAKTAPTGKKDTAKPKKTPTPNKNTTPSKQKPTTTNQKPGKKNKKTAATTKKTAATTKKTAATTKKKAATTKKTAPTTKKTVATKTTPLFKKKATSKRNTFRTTSTTTTEKNNIIKLDPSIFDHAEIKKALKADPLVRRIMKMAQKKRKEYLRKAKAEEERNAEYARL